MFGPDAIQATFKNPGDTYPDIIVPVARLASDEEGSMYFEMKRLNDALYSSPYYLTEPRKPGSVVRYTDRYHQDKAGVRPKLSTIKSSKAFFPDELHSILDPKAVRKLQTIKRRVDLSKYGDNEEEKDDDEEVDPETGEPKKVAEGEEELEEEVEDDDDDDDNDYGDDYFDNGENDLDEDRDEDANDY